MRAFVSYEEVHARDYCRMQDLVQNYAHVTIDALWLKHMHYLVTNESTPEPSNYYAIEVSATLTTE